jgi:hypothetical protein
MNKRRSKPRHTFHTRKLILFALFSVADLLMTWVLVQGTGGHVYESNPVAGAWLASYGWTGLAIFKSLAIVLVCGLVILISRYRPRTGGRILVFACSITAAVVVYSCFLCYRGAHAGTVLQEEAMMAECKSRWLDKEMHRQKSYQALLNCLGNDLIHHRISLSDGVERLENTDKAKSPQWLRILHRNYPGRSDGEVLALHLSYHTLVMSNNKPGTADGLLKELEAEYRATYGSDPQFDLSFLQCKAEGHNVRTSNLPGSDQSLPAAVLSSATSP